MSKLNFMLILSVLLLCGCTESDWIGLVKKGTLERYDRVKPVGLVFDGWTSCQKTNWEITKKNDDYAEVKYTCEIKGVEKVISALKENQNNTYDKNKLKIRELERSLKLKQDFLTEVRADSLINQMNAGNIAKSSIGELSSLLTDEEWKNLIIKYQKARNEILDKAISNSFKDEDEMKRYIHDEYVIWNEVYETTEQLNPQHIEGDLRRVDLDIPQVYELRKELTSYNNQQNFDALKNIKVVVLFGVNKKEFEIKQTIAEFLIGANAKQISHPPNFIGNIIYSNVNLSEQMNNLEDLAKMF